MANSNKNGFSENTSFRSFSGSIAGTNCDRLSEEGKVQNFSPPDPSMRTRADAGVGPSRGLVSTRFCVRATRGSLPRLSPALNGERHNLGSLALRQARLLISSPPALRDHPPRLLPVLRRAAATAHTTALEGGQARLSPALNRPTPHATALEGGQARLSPALNRPTPCLYRC